MSKNTKTLAPDEETQPGVVKNTPEGGLPRVVSFGLVKHHMRDGVRWGAVALETQGDKVLRTRLLEMDRLKEHVVFWLDRAVHRFREYGESPFVEEKDAQPNALPNALPKGVA